ncbi:MAG TPA: NAD(P)/FAD-dependent oxidoreductase [Clostridia bacterium]|nr:NAD(P)/FAD-dependent oxidoreductase [Clostridia bacterium]
MSCGKGKIIIIGGGAAGLTAAVAAARQGAAVTVLERLSRVGKKLLATGNGRCNYTNMDLDISRYHGKQPKFAMGILRRFDNRAAIEFFRDMGITPMVKEKGKVFPRSGQAGSVLDVLRYEAERLGVETIVEAEVSAVERTGAGFRITTASGDHFTAQSVILAAGGKASPNLGSNGSGYDLAESLGHSIVSPFPALTKLKLKADFLKQLSGIKVEGNAEIIYHGKTLAGDSGEILFTNYGVSGPPILQISRAASQKLQEGKTPQLKINLVPELTREELKQLLVERLETQSHKPLDFSFVGFMNKQLAPVVIKASGIADIKKPAGQVTAQEREKLLSIFQDWRFEISGTLPLSQAQVTAGGVDTGEIDSKTMESKLVPGLYFAGEIVDIDGDSGGFNLQWAWASGWIAGVSAAE